MQVMPDAVSKDGRHRLERFAAILERHGGLVAAAFGALFIMVSLLRGATKLMWFDELVTYYPARMPSLANLLSFYREGIDVHTPMAALVLRGAIAVFGDHHATNRL